MLNRQPLLPSAWPVAHHYDHLSPQSKSLETTRKHLQKPRTLLSIAGSIDSPTGIILAQPHSLASTTREAESTHQWSANTRILPPPRHPICEIKDAATGGLDSEAFRAIGELETVWWGGRDGEGVAISPGTIFILIIATLNSWLGCILLNKLWWGKRKISCSTW